MFSIFGYQVDIGFLCLTLIVPFIAAIKIYGQKKSEQFQYIQRYSFSPNIKDRLSKQYPNLTDSQPDWVIQRLRDYFLICHQAGRQVVAMPSKITDDAWCEFTLYTRSYSRFCLNAFGRFLHHAPIKIMILSNYAQDKIKDAWLLACKQEKLDPRKQIALPSLFQIDAQVNIQDGFIYTLSAPLGSGRSYCDNGFVYKLYCGHAGKRYCVDDIGRACKGECVGC